MLAEKDTEFQNLRQAKEESGGVMRVGGQDMRMTQVWLAIISIDHFHSKPARPVPSPAWAKKVKTCNARAPAGVG